MVAWAIKDFGGEIPRTESRNLPNNMAEASWNCDLSSGNIEGLPMPQQVIDLSSFAGTQRAYRLPGPTTGDPDVWVPLSSPYASVCRSPLANDTEHRLYWTIPGSGAFWNTYARIAAGNTGSNAPYNLGTIYPDSTVAPGVAAAGGTLDGSVPLISRSYCWTYVNQYGEESAPSAPSTALDGASDGTWTITGLPSAAPSNPSGFNYPTVTGVNLYRTSTGTSTGAQFYLVAQFTFGSSSPPASYSDTVSDTTAVNNNTLYSTQFANPLPDLDGLTALPSGMLIGFTGNTVHFCEPDRPHAWPAQYDQSLQYEISGFGVWQGSLIVMTAGFVSSGSGNSPSNFLFTQLRVPEPCIARGSIITDLMGVYYASQNGLVMLNYFGMQNQTLSMVTKNIWLTTFDASKIIACRHRSQYLAILNDGSGTGFLIDYSEGRLGMTQLNPFLGATCVWNDEYTGNAYICAGGVVYLWDSPTAGPLNFRWRSKLFYTPAPVSLGAVQISLDPSITTAPPSPNPIPLNNGDTSLVLPDGINAVFNCYAGTDGLDMVYSRNLTRVREIFRLPGGFKAFDWQFEVVSRVGVRSIEVASTMEELKGV